MGIQRTRDAHQECDADQYEKIVVDHGGIFSREALIDHHANGERDDEHHGCGGDEGNEGRHDDALIWSDEGQQAPQWAKPSRPRPSLGILFAGCGGRQLASRIVIVTCAHFSRAPGSFQFSAAV